MPERFFFDRNMLCLSKYDNNLHEQLSRSTLNSNNYSFIEGKNKKEIPAFVDKTGKAHTLHSLMSPEREAEKIIATLQDEGFIIILGLGGGYLAEAALKTTSVQKLLVIDFDIDGIAELLCSKDYITLFSDPRFTLLVDAEPEAIEAAVTTAYLPCIHNGIRVIPLRARCDFDTGHFFPASDAIRRAIEKVSVDYSVQAYFGRRWFSNVIHNIFALEKQFGIIAPESRIAICAAGPSLDHQLQRLKSKAESVYIISTDTAIGTLLNAGIKPDAVVSIDCQHISYLHFLGHDIQDIPLFLDLASPPLLYSRTASTVFFSGGHPLGNYISAFFKKIPFIDTSGANVTYAALSLAEKLGAKQVEIYGADFSYPCGNAYTKGAFFYPYLTMRQTRFEPATAQLYNFLFKNKTLRRLQNEHSYYYETRALAMYRKNLEKKGRTTTCGIDIVPGYGAPVNITRNISGGITDRKMIELFSSGKSTMSAAEFLYDYRQKIKELPPLNESRGDYMAELSDFGKNIFTTILPAAAAIKRTFPLLSNRDLIEEVKNYCSAKIEELL
jgi:hypothetical protein